MYINVMCRVSLAYSELDSVYKLGPRAV